ncbi:MAG: hypothetical protein ACYC19_00665 [Acidimicrobiales bacterium]
MASGSRSSPYAEPVSLVLFARVGALVEATYRYNQGVMVLERVQGHPERLAAGSLSRPCRPGASRGVLESAVDARTTRV